MTKWLSIRIRWGLDSFKRQRANLNFTNISYDTIFITPINSEWIWKSQNKIRFHWHLFCEPLLIVQEQVYWSVTVQLFPFVGYLCAIWRVVVSIDAIFKSCLVDFDLVVLLIRTIVSIAVSSPSIDRLFSTFVNIYELYFNNIVLRHIKIFHYRSCLEN